MVIGWRMVDVRNVLLFFSTTFFLFGCSSQPVPHQSTGRNASTATPSQTINRNTLTADTASEELGNAIREGSIYIGSRIQVNSKIGVVNMQSSSENLSNYVVDSIVMHLINADRFIIVERSEMGIIQREQKHQLSGEVSDSTAISIGQQLGVQYIVTGSILPLGNNYSLGLKITNVQTAQIIGQKIYTIKPDNILLSLINPPLESVVANEQGTETPQNVIMGDVNITNNNTTTIHGDVHVNMPQGFFGR